MTRLVWLATVVLALASLTSVSSCKKTKPAARETGSAAPSIGSGSAHEPDLLAMPPMPSEVIKLEGFATPESFTFDGAGNYWVSNINGSPFAKDDNGFISKLTRTGEIVNLKFIDGANAAITLHAPKGIAVLGDVLFVTDIDTVRRFDVTTGAPIGETKIEGATFLNDISLDGTGTLIVSDSGVKADGDKSTKSGTDAIYQLDKDGKVLASVKSKELGGPNGLTADNYAVAGAHLLRVWPASGTFEVVQTLPFGMLDGAAWAFIDGRPQLVVTSWQCECVLIGEPKGAWRQLAKVAGGDISFDAGLKQLLIPVPGENRVEIHRL